MQAKNISGWLATAVLLAASTHATAQQTQPSNEPLGSTTARFSYALGMEIGASLKNMGTEIDLSAFTRGVTDLVEGNSALLTTEQAEQAKREVFATMQAHRAKQMKIQADKNQQEGEAFLKENQNKDGVVTTDSGLQYQVLREGDGPMPTPDDRVSVHYRGTLLDGTEFDSSYKRGEPTTFPLKGVIPGWTEGLQLMNVGSSHRLFIPPPLAYGENGAGGQIGPNATLIFEIELLKIEP